MLAGRWPRVCGVCGGVHGAWDCGAPGSVVLRGSGFRLRAWLHVPHVGLCCPRSLRTRRVLLLLLIPFRTSSSGWGLTSPLFPPPDASDRPSGDVSLRDPPRHRGLAPSSPRFSRTCCPQPPHSGSCPGPGSAFLHGGVPSPERFPPTGLSPTVLPLPGVCPSRPRVPSEKGTGLNYLFSLC